jgi:isopentenyl diphosphate isomerase/L-lactate dehydrogenase-like FMN-dependent dehydrogenase
MYDGINMTSVAMQNPSMTWEFVDRLRKATSLKLYIKGIDTREDGRLAVEHGMDGILVSNHGGRSTDTGRSTIEALPEIVNEVSGRVPASAGERTCSRRSRSEPRQWESAAPSFGDWERSAKRESNGCSRFFKASCGL